MTERASQDTSDGPTVPRLIYIDYIHNPEDILPVIKVLEVLLGVGIDVIKVPNTLSGPCGDGVEQMLREQGAIPTGKGKDSTVTQAPVVFGFVCGSSYVLLSDGGLSDEDEDDDRDSSCFVDLISAPIPVQDCYRGQPLYSSEMVVRADSKYTDSTHLEGTRFGFNDPVSWSGYYVVCNWLASLRSPRTLNTYFTSAIVTGGHARSVQAILKGTIDCAAIDSNVLCRLPQEERDQLRVLRDCPLGPFPIQPVVISRHASPSIRLALQQALAMVHLPRHDEAIQATLARPLLAQGARQEGEVSNEQDALFEHKHSALDTLMISHFIDVSEEYYEPIRNGVIRSHELQNRSSASGSTNGKGKGKSCRSYQRLARQRELLDSCAPVEAGPS